MTGPVAYPFYYFSSILLLLRDETIANGMSILNKIPVFVL